MKLSTLIPLASAGGIPAYPMHLYMESTRCKRK